MNSRKNVVSTFEDLIRGYYGGSADVELRPITMFEDLLAGYYGKGRESKAASAPVPAVTMSADDGEVLAQPADSTFEEYVVARSLSEPDWTEYIVERAGISSASSLERSQSITDQATSAEECHVDILDLPLAPGGQRPTSSADWGRPAPPVRSAPAQTVAAQSVATGSKAEAPRANENDFAADLKSILSGQMVYDPAQKKMVPRDQVGRQESRTPRPENAQPAPQATNQHEIFDRIRESMQYAQAYDLGTVELQNRFNDFDRFQDLQRKPKAKSSAAPSVASAPKADTSDFIRDLDAIRNQRTQAATLSVDEGKVSRPLFDTGEHVLIASDMYPEMLRVGKDPGVKFSYGQIIAMADLYGSVDQMMRADPAELQNIKTLIERSTEFYRTGKRSQNLDVHNEEWDNATGGRYLDLAEANYEHFSPNYIFPNAPFAGSLNQHGTNKSAWEAYHKQAIEEAQKALLSANPNTSIFLEYPLIVNGFGDHFLTDAFAAGHVINKEEMIAYFKSNFFDGAALKPEGEQFFEKLAQQAFRGEVARKFSDLESANYPVCRWGWCLKWHPNINSTSRFQDMLTTAAKEQPDGVANFAVKALHDRLNEDGVEVTNLAGDKPWKITGDGFMNDDSKVIIRKAVQQSVDNINDLSILADNLNFGSYFTKVWKYVPQLTESSRQRVLALAGEYLSPTSDHLVKAAADIITRDLDSIIKTLVRDKKLKAA